MYIRTSFVCSTLRVSSIRIFILIDPKYNSYIHKYTRLHREATGKATDEEFDTHNKLHFLSRLRNSTKATKISQSEEFEKFYRYSLKNCIEKALMLESRLQIREMVTIAKENLENKEPKVMEMSEEGEEQQEELNILSEDKGPGRFRNPNLANLICYKCGGYGHYGRECPEANQAMEQLEDRIVGRIEHSFNAYTLVTLQYMNDMIVKAAKLEVSRKLAKKKLEKLKNQKGGDPQDKTQYPAGRGRGQPPRQGQQVGRPPLTPTAPPMPAQQTPHPTTTRGRGRGGANVVIKRGGRQGTPPPQDPQQTTKKVTFQQPAQVKVKSEPEQVKVGPNPFLQPNPFSQPHLPEIHEMTEDLEETDLDNMSQEELHELQHQLDQELQAEFQEEVIEEAQWLAKAYQPETYFRCVEDIKEPREERVMEITLSDSKSAIIPAEIAHEKCRVLIDTEASRSFMREDYFRKLPNVKLMPTLRNVRIRSATGRDVQTLGRTKAQFKLGITTYCSEFIVCRNLRRPAILGIDFLRKYRLGTTWTEEGKFALQKGDDILVESIEVFFEDTYPDIKSYEMHGHTS